MCDLDHVRVKRLMFGMNTLEYYGITESTACACIKVIREVIAEELDCACSQPEFGANGSPAAGGSSGDSCGWVELQWCRKVFWFAPYFC